MTDMKGISDERIAELRARADEGGSITLHEGTELVAIIDRLRAAEANVAMAEFALQQGKQNLDAVADERNKLREQLAVMEKALDIETFSVYDPTNSEKEVAIDIARQQIAAEKGEKG